MNKKLKSIEIEITRHIIGTVMIACATSLLLLPWYMLYSAGYEEVIGNIGLTLSLCILLVVSIFSLTIIIQSIITILTLRVKKGAIKASILIGKNHE